MTKKSAAKKPGPRKKLTLKKETLSDLSPSNGMPDLVRGGNSISGSYKVPTRG